MIAGDLSITKISTNRMLERCTLCYQNYRKEVSSEPIKNPGTNHQKGAGEQPKSGRETEFVHRERSSIEIETLVRLR